MGPLSRAVAEYLEGDFSRFHTPGHKGKDRFAPHFGWGEVWCWDVTECAGLDSLFEASGPIRETEQLYSRLYGTADSLISAGGSTLCIQAMLALALQPGDSLLAVRGVHSSAVHAMALLDLHPQWVLPSIDQATGLAGAVCPEEVERAFTCNPRLKAVYLTSPNYFGSISDIATLSKVCHSFGVPLLVDNAHGAHLAFLPQSLHPIGLGADLCCDSLHKTLPVLTGGAMLHVGNKAYASQARRKMALFGSTSPSYPVMLSIGGAGGCHRRGAGLLYAPVPPQRPLAAHLERSSPWVGRTRAGGSSAGAPNRAGTGVRPVLRVDGKPRQHRGGFSPLGRRA